MQIDELVNSLRAKFVLPPLYPDADGSYHLTIDGIDVTIAVNEATLTSTLIADLGYLDDDDDRTRELLLEANLGADRASGASFSLRSDTIQLTRRMPLRNLHFRVFTNLLGRFVDEAEYWQHKLSGTEAEYLARSAAPSAAMMRI